VPPAYPYYNPGNLPPYSYDLTLAKQEIANSPCAGGACAGTAINYEYLDIGADWAEMASFLVNDLQAIGITVTAIPISLPDLYVEQALNSNGVCNSATNTNGGPFYMGQEFYTSDYISPDDWTQNDAYSLGSANMCMAGYDNATVDQLVYQAAAESNPVNLTNDYATMTSLMYYNYSDIWMVVPTSFAVYANNVNGVIINPMGSAEPYAILFNTQWLS
jgi:ABC-type transport system substrate-binding protein